MTIDDLVEEIKFIVSDGNVLRLDTNEAERLLYWLTEYRAMISGRQSDNLSERLAEHLVWAESNSYECPITLAEDLQEAIRALNHDENAIVFLNEQIKERENELDNLQSTLETAEHKLAEMEIIIGSMDGEIKRLHSVSSWHSCDEKPPERISYLLTDGYCVYLGYYAISENHWTTEEDTDGNSLLYWMPIPKPPKEMNNNDEETA